jgi:hypothetical protein
MELVSPLVSIARKTPIRLGNARPGRERADQRLETFTFEGNQSMVDQIVKQFVKEDREHV